MLGLLNIPNIDLTLDLTFLQISDFIHQTSATFLYTPMLGMMLGIMLGLMVGLAYRS